MTDDHDYVHPDAHLAKRWVLLDDDLRMGLHKGDVLLCVPYWLDPDKLTVIRREADGFDPCCNVYRSQVERAEQSGRIAPP